MPSASGFSSHPAISTIKMISRERAVSSGPASQPPKTSRTASSERATRVSTCSRDGKRNALLVVSVPCGKRREAWNEMTSLFRPRILTGGVISSRHSTRALERTRSGGSEDKAANMRQVCHAAGLHLCYSASVEELSEKPKTN